MDTDVLKIRKFETELTYTASRSGGPGGQHVNKTETKVELRFNIPASNILTEEEKERLLKKLSGKLTTTGDLLITCQETRSQAQNREIATERFYETLAEGLKVPKKRKRKRPSKAYHRRRLNEKKQQSEKKQQRKPPEV